MQIKRGVQITIGVIFLTIVILNCRFNHIGQNIINIVAASIFIAGLDNSIIMYQYYLDQSSFEHEANFSIFAFFLLGLFFENFNSSPKNSMFLNQFSFFFIMIILGLNAICYVAFMMILIGFFIRHLYRLMNDKLLVNQTFL